MPTIDGLIYSSNVLQHIRFIISSLLFYFSSLQGKIACANVLSDLYAMGVEHCDNMLMLLGVSEVLTKRQREVITPLVIQGFNG